MASTATPYGFRPVGLLSGRVYNNALRLLPIASAYATAIGMGDPVKLAAGVVQKDIGTTAMTPLGIFMGCFYTDPNTNQPSYHQNWKASTAATDALAYVVDDPDVVFQIQADGTLAYTTLGRNVATNVGTVSATGLSNASLAASTQSTLATLPVRILDFVNGKTGSTDSFPDVLCIWNAGMHQYRNATGVT